MDTVTRMLSFFLTVNAALLPIDMRLTCRIVPLSPDMDREESSRKNL